MPDNHTPNDQPSQGTGLMDQLARLIQSIQASGRAILPHTNDALLKSIVEAAAHIFGAEAASIALLDEARGVLEFKVSVGQGSSDVIGMSIPMDKGIAGHVAMTGQPIAVSNVQQDPRFAKDFAQNTGYVPRSILATPLLSKDRVIGVMEVLDKIQADSFGMQDMELLGIFARQAALAIDQSQKYDRIGDALVLGLKRLAGEDLSADSGGAMLGALDRINADQLQAGDLLALADLFNRISELGSAERRACIKILEAFAEYGSGKSKIHAGGFKP
jgi:GAF domain-containing protein